MPIQAILFDIYQWTRPKAIAFMKKHNYHYLKIHDTERYHRFRMVKPNKRYIYQTKHLPKGVTLILYYDPKIHQHIIAGFDLSSIPSDANAFYRNTVINLYLTSVSVGDHYQNLLIR